MLLMGPIYMTREVTYGLHTIFAFYLYCESEKTDLEIQINLHVFSTPEYTKVV
jgi:hypothetical protein